MKFWTILRWVSTAVFAIVLVYALGVPSAESPPQPSSPSRPAPMFFR